MTRKPSVGFINDVTRTDEMDFRYQMTRIRVMGFMPYMTRKPILDFKMDLTGTEQEGLHL